MTDQPMMNRVSAAHEKARANWIRSRSWELVARHALTVDTACAVAVAVRDHFTLKAAEGDLPSVARCGGAVGRDLAAALGSSSARGLASAAADALSLIALSEDLRAERDAFIEGFLRGVDRAHGEDVVHAPIDDADMDRRVRRLARAAAGATP